MDWTVSIDVHTHTRTHSPYLSLYVSIYPSASPYPFSLSLSLSLSLARSHVCVLDSILIDTYCPMIYHDNNNGWVLIDVRYQCDHRDEFSRFGWTEHNGRDYGTQVLQDPRSALNLTIQVVRSTSGYLSFTLLLYFTFSNYMHICYAHTHTTHARTPAHTRN